MKQTKPANLRLENYYYSKQTEQQQQIEYCVLEDKKKRSECSTENIKMQRERVIIIINNGSANAPNGLRQSNKKAHDQHNHHYQSQCPRSNVFFSDHQIGSHNVFFFGFFQITKKKNSGGNRPTINYLPGLNYSTTTISNINIDICG